MFASERSVQLNLSRCVTTTVTVLFLIGCTRKDGLTVIQGLDDTEVNGMVQEVGDAFVTPAGYRP